MSRVILMKSTENTLNKSEVLTEIEGIAGVITLNRPKTLNSLNLSMIRSITQALKDWRDDPSVQVVLIKSTGEKAFCAGGDVRSVYEAKHRGDWDYIDAIFREEYILNHSIQHYPKPYVALIDGICMGGGLGISVHGTHRIVTERTIMAMPESTIGFITDVGASFFFNHCPGNLGIYLGLLGERITASDALFCGLANHFVPSSQLVSLSQQIIKGENLTECLAQFQTKPDEPSFLKQHQPIIDHLFEGQSVKDIISNFEKEGSDFSQKCLQSLRKKSPTSLKLILALLLRTKNLSLKECLIQEFRLSWACARGHDFFEGVRALLVDKDQNPHWIPATLAEVSGQEIEACFQSLGTMELNFVES